MTRPICLLSAVNCRHEATLASRTHEWRSSFQRLFFTWNSPSRAENRWFKKILQPSPSMKLHCWLLDAFSVAHSLETKSTTVARFSVWLRDRRRQAKTLPAKLFKIKVLLDCASNYISVWRSPITPDLRDDQRQTNTPLTRAQKKRQIIRSIKVLFVTWLLRCITFYTGISVYFDHCVNVLRICNCALPLFLFFNLHFTSLS